MPLTLARRRMASNPSHGTHTGWLITAQGIGAVASLIAIAVTLNRPIQYVAALGAAVDRLSAVAERLDASTRLQDERISALEQRVARLGEGLDDARRVIAAQDQRLRDAERRP